LNEEDIAGLMHKNLIKDIIFLILGIGLFVYAMSGHIKAIGLEQRCQDRTQGVIVDNIKGGKGYDLVIAEYSVNSTVYQAVGLGRYYSEDNGKPIVVYYNAENPSEAYTGTGPQEPELFFHIMGVICILASIWSLFHERLIAENALSTGKK